MDHEAKLEAIVLKIDVLDVLAHNDVPGSVQSDVSNIICRLALLGKEE